MNCKVSFWVVGFPTVLITKKVFNDLIKVILPERCHFTISTMCDSVGVDSNDTSTDISKLLQQVLYSTEVNGVFEHRDNSFKTFLELWLKACSCVFPEHALPWLQDKTASTYSGRSYHDLGAFPVYFGTLKSSSCFAVHQIITGNVSFFHDTRIMKIYYSHTTYSHKRKNRQHSKLQIKCLILVYKNIRHILVNESNLLLLYSKPPTVRNGNETGRLDSWPLKPDVLGLSTGILLQALPNDILDELVSRLHIRCTKMPITFLNLSITQTDLPEVVSPRTISTRLTLSFCRKGLTDPILEELNTTPHKMSFDCLYLIEALVRQKYLLKLQGIQDFVSTANSLFLDQPHILEKALSDLVSVEELAFPINYTASLVRWYNYLKENCSNDKKTYFVPERTAVIRKAVLTPTRVLLYPKEINFENRILRNFDPEFALRVSFRDDDFVKLNTRLPLSVEIENSTIGYPMQHGLLIAGRRYDFLAWSNSQIRDHSVWMYAKNDKNETSASIRKWMGDFSKIKNVAKYMSRMGQCFSHTSDTVGIPMNSLHIALENDIEGGWNIETEKPYCFSDGIGKISEGTALKICKNLQLTSLPSAYQIRYGGVKGVVVLDPTLKDKELVLRRSMVKFPSNSDRLEVVQSSSPTKVFLNRPMIAILEYHGVNTGVLLRIQEDTLQFLTEMLLNSKQAAEYLALHHNLEGVDFENAYKCGIDLCSEPFFRAMLLARHQYDVVNLKEKTRLLIDPSEGRNMFGTLDETGTLKYGQVFIQYTTDILKKECRENRTTLIGNVLVTKNPCYLAGDVRIFECVHVPELRHIVDCIVFPQHGPRPHPNEMSGSDLDGDEYVVIWKKELLFPKNEKPGTFPSQKEKTLSRPIEVNDMVRFLVDFIKNDRIGYIASSHLATSDLLGVNRTKSVSLARFCSIAVDFPKTGEVANLDATLRPTKYPDFMERSLKESYRSKRALGKLYRVCRDFQSSASVAFNNSYEKAVVDPDLKYPGWEKYKIEAEEALISYSNCLQQFLRTYGVNHESEAMTGAFSVVHSRFKETKDRFEISKLIAIYIRSLWKKYKHEFWRDMAKDGSFATESLKKISAYYVVTYSQTNPTVLSLPWIFTKELSQIKLLRLSERREIVKPDVRPIFIKLNSELQKIVKKNAVLFEFLELGALPACYGSNSQTLVTATQVLLHWARKVKLLEQPGAQRPGEGFMSEHSMKKLILHVAAGETKDDGPIALVLNFLRFCMSLRFTSEQKRRTILPFSIPMSSFLSKAAMLSYRDLAMSGDLSALHVGTSNREEQLVEMEPIRVQKNTIIINLKLVTVLLSQWSGVSNVSIRSDGRWQYVVMAQGKRSCVRKLETILRKGDDYLKIAILRRCLSDNDNIIKYLCNS